MQLLNKLKEKIFGKKHSGFISSDEQDCDQLYDSFYNMIKPYLPIKKLEDNAIGCWHDFVDECKYVVFDYNDDITVTTYSQSDPHAKFHITIFDSGKIDVDFTGLFRRVGQLSFNSMKEFKNYIESGSGLDGYEIMTTYIGKFNLMTSNARNALELTRL